MKGKTLRLPPHGAAAKNLHPDTKLDKVPTPTPIQKGSLELPKSSRMSMKPIISMDTDGYPWISVDIHGHPLISMDPLEYPWISMDVNGYPWILGYP